MKCIARVQAGVCGFTTTITADSPDDQMVRLDIATDCDKIAAVARELNAKEIDGYQEIGAGFSGAIMSAARAALAGCCAGCVVPAAIFKSLQVAARVALPKDISISLSTE